MINIDFTKLEVMHESAKINGCNWNVDYCVDDDTYAIIINNSERTFEMIDEDFTVLVDLALEWLDYLDTANDNDDET